MYCAAAEAGFDALVVRDRSQLDQLAEMYVLFALSALTVVTWRKGIDGPVREWGQLLAYLPQVEAAMPRSRRSCDPAPCAHARATTVFTTPKQPSAPRRIVVMFEWGRYQDSQRSEIGNWLDLSGEGLSIDSMQARSLRILESRVSFWPGVTATCPPRWKLAVCGGRAATQCGL